MASARVKISRETLAQKQARMAEVLMVFKRVYAHAKCSLNFDSPFQLLVATVLSAQCTDERVNKVTPILFGRYPTARAMSGATLTQIEKLVQSTGFYKNKARAIKELSRSIIEAHGGEVPRTLDALTALRGVGRKTANVVLGNAFGVPGLVVDTHVGRLSRRLGFTKETDAVKVEYAMMDVVAREDWTIFSHLLIYHGRARCTARSPKCEGCEVSAFCPRVGV